MSLAIPFALSPAARHLRLNRQRAVALGGIPFVVLVGLEMALLSPVPQRPPGTTPAAAAVAAVDPRLIVYRRTLPITSTLLGGLRVTGTLYPAIPGPNTLRLTMHGRSQATQLRGGIRLVVAMPGMVMAPVTATLVPRGRGYSGVVALPMFGRYQAQVITLAAAHRSSGTLTITLSLPAWQG